MIFIYFVPEYAAGQAACRVEGVKAIAEESAVRLPRQKKTADDEGAKS